ncbi:hypothetical protein DL768_006588 [Monosporascus sp. mg162]|nr:hypothetical protein DL768_006588 [Monosporascus sp. mg162]
MALPQNREGNFNPTSPHSSSGVADSFKGTPDTRLTAFSPEDGSTRSAKAPGPLNLIGREITQARYPVSSPSSFDHSKKFCHTDLHLERDPFMTSSGPAVKPTPKLSPTATSFFPLKAQLGFHASASELDYSNREATREPNHIYEPTITRLHTAEHRDLQRGWGAVTCHEGQIYLTVFPHGVNLPNDLKQLEIIVKNILQGEGDLFAFKLQPGVEGSLLSALIEYCDNDMSLNAVSHLNGTVANVGCIMFFDNDRLAHFVQGLHLCMVLHRPDLAPSMPNGLHEGTLSPTRTAMTGSDLASELQHMSVSSRAHSAAPSMHSSLFNTPARSPIPTPFQLQPSYGMVPVVYHSIPVSPPYVLDPNQPRSHSAIMSSSNYSLMSPIMAPSTPFTSTDLMTPRHFQQPRYTDGRRHHAMRVARTSFYNPNTHHNHVDVNRIREGTDVRTTIMLRNIPNKVDQEMLKDIVDQSSKGKYDFMYLRIDFANDCNVGYAFINFVDPLDIIDFVNARGNKRWNCFKSDKVAEISYATIQGKDCLVQKFRNSSLFYTVNGPHPEMAGKEEPFPGPDNQSKMKRSCENAEHVGLFTPNAGQHFRDEQRRRRSQFDRGTRLAALEEFDQDMAIHHNLYSLQ